MSAQPNDGGPAFPNYGPDKVFDRTTATGGMSLRDWFAGMALQGLLPTTEGWDPTHYALLAYQAADAMLAERERRQNQSTAELDCSPFKVGEFAWLQQEVTEALCRVEQLHEGGKVTVTANDRTLVVQVQQLKPINSESQTSAERERRNGGQP